LPGVYTVATNAAASPASPASSPDVSPSPSPCDVEAPVTIATGVDDRWQRSDVVVHLSATDPVSGVAYTLFKVDDGAWTKGTRIEVRALNNHADDGAHAIRFYSVDNAQNVEQEKSVTVKIDTTPPRFEWRDVSPAVIDRAQAVRLRLIIRDIGGPIRLSWRVTDQYGAFAASKGGLEREPGWRAIEVTPRYKNHGAFLPGLYKVGLTLTDQAGNVTVTGTRAFRDYRSAPAKVWRHVSGAGRRVAGARGRAQGVPGSAGVGRRVVSPRLFRRRHPARIHEERGMPDRFDRAVLGCDLRRRGAGPLGAGNGRGRGASDSAG
jgi:hypothetical protein